MNQQVRFGLVVVGDELLSGKRQDKHMHKVIELLDARGLELSWARYAGDDPEILTQTYRETFASGAVVFSCGGIGGTPDDRTRQCAAAAAGVQIAPHSEGLRELEIQFGPETTPLRRRMVEFPLGSTIIPNPVNRVPGFSLDRHHFVPGFPSMAWPMIEWVLDSRYAELSQPGRVAERIISVLDCRESQIIPLMESFEQRYAALRLSCLPHSDVGRYQLELALRGAPAAVAQAMAELQGEVARLGFEWQEVTLSRRQ
jgi:molybdopterin-biosynthesis enzyme MoeA-like protein